LKDKCMSDKILDKRFWQQRYDENQAGWDIGYASGPLATYIDQVTNKNLRILIPGCGNSYEGEYLWKKGFANVVLSDLAESPKRNFLERVPNFPESQWLGRDFFSIQAEFDLILEQTFYCAINPNLRDRYVQKMHELLAPKGKLVGVLFNFPLTELGPPFGGSIDEYFQRFSPFFNVQTLEVCRNSIAPRAGREVFMIAEKK